MVIITIIFFAASVVLLGLNLDYRMKCKSLEKDLRCAEFRLGLNHQRIKRLRDDLDSIRRTSKAIDAHFDNLPGLDIKNLRKFLKGNHKYSSFTYTYIRGKVSTKCKSIKELDELMSNLLNKEENE